MGSFLIVKKIKQVDMLIIRSARELQKYIETVKNEQQTIGFAPTMGALHAGHLSLYEMARLENDIVISSIFVNPTQFNNPEDFEKYPNTLEKDIELLINSGWVDVLYLPTSKDLYPDGVKSKKYDLGSIEEVMEGKYRSGHFQGVATVVEELLLQTKPDRAYFGEKDFQQIAVIRRLVDLKSFKVDIRTVPTMREYNGLAMSSRNLRLSNIGKERATIIYETLLSVKNWLKVYTILEIEEKVRGIFSEQSSMVLEYFTIAYSDTLEEVLEYSENREIRAFIVVNVEGVRLIDNMCMNC